MKFGFGGGCRARSERARDGVPPQKEEKRGALGVQRAYGTHASVERAKCAASGSCLGAFATFLAGRREGGFAYRRRSGRKGLALVRAGKLLRNPVASDIGLINK